MDIRPIKSGEDYIRALTRLEEIFDASVDSPEGDEAEILSVLIESYENTYFPIEAPDPIEAIKIRMEEMNLKQKDLVGIMGGKSRVSEILNRKKRLTVAMIRNLTRELHLPPSLLINPYHLDQ
ncbi:MAG TPA: hypothetical protein PKL65_13585 [Bacteroidales bacterium]|nr:hypothetical protein [Bacteroidales bacterium]